MTRFLFRNMGTKLLALAIALLAWFLLSAQRRERISERGYRIPLSVVNIPARTMIASSPPPALDVRVRGPFTALRQLEPEKLEAVVDLLGREPGERVHRFVPEDVNVPPEVEVISIAPQEIRITIDSVAEKFLPIVPALSGEPAPGQRVVDVDVEPRLARVVGPASALAEMTSIRTDPVSVAGRDATFSMPATVLAGAPGVRVREGQVVRVTVGISPAEPLPTPSPTPAALRRR